MEDTITEQYCEDCKRKTLEGKFFWLCEKCRELFEPKEDMEKILQKS